MTNSKTKAVDSPNLSEQETFLTEAYAHSASQDKLIASDFDAFPNDGLMNKYASRSTTDFAKTVYANRRLDKRM